MQDFKQMLEPILEMLEAKEKTMPREDWFALVVSTKERINTVPEQYIDVAVKPSVALARTIDEIFKERLN